MKNRRMLTLILTAVCAIAILWGPPDAHAQKELSVLTWNISYFKDGFQQWVSEFNKIHPDITIVRFDKKGSEWSTYYQTQVVAGLRRAGAQLLDDRGVIAVGHEADVLAVGLGGDRKPHLLRDLANVALDLGPERKHQLGELRLRRREQEIALVACRIGTAVEHRTTRTIAPFDVMPRRERIGVEIPRGLEKVEELHVLVAGNAGNWGFAGRIAVGKGGDHLFPEPGLIVEDVVGNAERFGECEAPDDGTASRPLSTTCRRTRPGFAQTAALEY